jgi:signal transduction histidine kinase
MWHKLGAKSQWIALSQWGAKEICDIEQARKLKRQLEKGDGSRCYGSKYFSSPRWIDQVLETSINVSPRTADKVTLSETRAAHDFLKEMSHQLHTPLHVIIGLCQLLERDRDTSLSPMHLDSVERMERNARALLLTVNHLLNCIRNGQFE